MAQHKIDNQIREKLNAREIQPSAPAWDRLDAMLTVSEEKKSKKGFGWFFVAASTILFFGLGFFLFDSNNSPKIDNLNPIVTTINEEIDTVETNKINEISIEKQQPVLVQNEVNYSKKQSRFIKSVETNELIKEKNIIQENPTPNTQHPTPNTYKYVSPENLLAEIEQPKSEENVKIKSISTSKIQINATELLTKVENEIQQNYKESTFDKLKRNFNEAKTAVANRNYE
uniref:hypothetical protein n=1 Tax=Flavobacterium sp. TaxID=239 RepID=UPI004048D7A2